MQISDSLMVNILNVKFIAKGIATSVPYWCSSQHTQKSGEWK